MIYNIDTIPAKTFFKIQETNNVKLLTDDDKIEEKDLVEAWGKIQKNYKKIAEVKDSNRVVLLFSKIHSLKAKYLSVSSAVKVLLKKESSVCEQILKDYGYRLSKENYKQDLETILKNTNSIKVRISKYEADLKRLLPKKEVKSVNTFEDGLMAMCVILEMGYINSNTIILTDYLSLIKQTKTKLKSLESINKKS